MVTGELHGAVHQVPADASNHLFAPRVKEARNVDGGTRGGPAEHAVLLYQQRPRTQLRCLNRRDRPRRATPDDRNVVIQSAPPSSRFVEALRLSIQGRCQYAQRRRLARSSSRQPHPVVLGDNEYG